METATPRRMLTIGKVSLGDLTSLVQLKERSVAAYSWFNAQDIALTEAKQQQLVIVQSRLLNDPTHLLNECRSLGADDLRLF